MKLDEIDTVHVRIIFDIPFEFDYCHRNEIYNIYGSSKMKNIYMYTSSAKHGLLIPSLVCILGTRIGFFSLMIPNR